MSNANFYIIDEKMHGECHSMPAHFVQACSIASFYYSHNQKVFIYTDDQQDAFNIDEYLWQFDGDSFIPHNLLGEGPSYGSPVEISWQAPTHYCSVLINLSLQAPKFSNHFQQVIDFVPFDEQLKIQARQRYTTYKKLGHILSTTNVEIKHSTHKVD
ncbi:MAG: DNA polymerase III subunit chi [Psychromonas sp.]|nr:DNA polymerase III subunit chi [Psychromonas sp.]